MRKNLSVTARSTSKKNTTQIFVSGISGRFEKRITPSAGVFKLSAPERSAGMYFCSITDAGKQNVLAKLVIE